MKDFIHDDEYLYTVKKPNGNTLRKYGFKKYGKSYKYYPYKDPIQYNNDEFIIIEDDGMLFVRTTYIGLNAVQITLFNLVKDGVIEIRRGDQ